MSYLQSGIMTLIKNGALELIVFGLVFVVTFGIFRKIKLFVVGKDEDGKKLKQMKSVHTIMSLVLAALVIIPRYIAPGSSYDIIPVLERSLPQMSFLLVAILCALIILGFFGMSIGRNSTKGNPIKLIVFLVSIGFIVWIFGSNMNWWVNPIAHILTPDIVAVIIAVLVFAMIVSFVMGDAEEKYTWKDYIDNEKAPVWKKAKAYQKFHDFMRDKKVE
jgi:hypothetical protein